MTQRLNLRALLALTILILGGPAFAMDCQKAASPIDKAICADPAAAAADAAMSSAYSALFGTASDSSKKQILQSQRDWLKNRAGICTDDKKPSVKCLTEWTQRRAAFLQGKPESGPGTGHDLMPVIINQAGTDKLYEQDITASKFAAPVLPGEKLFNADIEKLLADAPSKKDDGDHGDTGMTFTYDLNLRVTYASPKFLSAHQDSYIFSGGAHGNNATTNININIATGKDLRYGDIFLPEAKVKLADLCVEQIKAQKKSKDMKYGEGLYTPEELRKTIEDGVSGIDRMSFSEKQAVVTFDPYELGAYVEGAYECMFSTETLRPMTKPGGVLQ